MKKKGNGTMTKREMVTICVEDQIERGIIPATAKEIVIRGYLKGAGCVKPITKAECERWMEMIAERQ